MSNLPVTVDAKITCTRPPNSTDRIGAEVTVTFSAPYTFVLTASFPDIPSLRSAKRQGMVIAGHIIITAAEKPAEKVEIATDGTAVVTYSLGRDKKFQVQVEGVDSIHDARTAATDLLQNFVVQYRQEIPTDALQALKQHQETPYPWLTSLLETIS